MYFLPTTSAPLWPNTWAGTVSRPASITGKSKAAGNDFNNAEGDYTFNGIFTKSVPTAVGSGGADLADLLLGYPASGNIYTSTKLSQFANYYGVYVQDDFRVNPKLTLNLGLRWEH